MTDSTPSARPAGAMTYGCTCGAVRGTARGLRPDNGLRLVCMCSDCQAFLVHLGREDLLDAHRGTDIYQTRPSRLRIDDGADQLRCLRLGPKGLFRWYAACCNTPMGNSVAPAWVPFIGVNTAALGPADERDALGPVRFRVHARRAPDPAAAPGHQTVSLSLIVRWVRFMARGCVERSHTPSPVRNADGSWISEPRVLTEAERADAYR